jgi:hypothetical protein
MNLNLIILIKKEYLEAKIAKIEISEKICE